MMKPKDKSKKYQNKKLQKNIISLNMIKDASEDSIFMQSKLSRKSTNQEKDTNCVYYQFKNSISQVHNDSLGSEPNSHHPSEDISKKKTKRKQVPLNISLKKNLEMNSRSRESSLKREVQKNLEKKLLDGVPSEPAHSSTDLHIHGKSKTKVKKIKRNNWRNIFNKQIKMRQENASNGNYNIQSELDGTICMSNQDKSKPSFNLPNNQIQMSFRIFH